MPFVCAQLLNRARIRDVFYIKQRRIYILAMYFILNKEGFTRDFRGRISLRLDIGIRYFLGLSYTQFSCL